MLIWIIFSGVLLVDLDGKLFLFHTLDLAVEDLLVRHEGSVTVTTTCTTTAGCLVHFAHPKGFFYVHNF